MSLEVRGVSVRFGGVTALSDVELLVPNGSITGLIGPNGAGKTTLFNVITGMQRPVGGRVLLDGRDLAGVPAYRRARLGLGRTFQRLELFGTLTVRENLMVAPSPERRRRRSTRPAPASVPVSASPSAPASAEPVIDRLGLGDVAEVRADALPTGTGRLVELGRALMARPKVLLLDEPASGQDTEETARFADVLRSLAADGMAVLLVEHDMELVMSVCDQITVLDYGKVLCTGDPLTVQHDPLVQSAYLGTAHPAGTRVDG